MPRHDPNDPEMAPQPPSIEEQLEGTMFDRPAAPTARARTDVRYATWRLTPDGKAAFHWIEQEALARATRGDKRIGSKSLVEQARDKIHVHINNLFTPCIGRELVLRHRHLQDHFEFRERTAA